MLTFTLNFDWFQSKHCQDGVEEQSFQCARTRIGWYLFTSSSLQISPLITRDVNYHQIVQLRRVIIITDSAVNLSLETVKLLMGFNEVGFFRVMGGMRVIFFSNCLQEWSQQFQTIPLKVLVN